ncbi:hypothetical protein ACJ73_04206 [Blastomyces percursus]|uniref:Uncharacterized protein n=1 Tax=Blastomyces percursus TaxID=1658174 RepID=A0A1J9R7G9_9EURO|nr:hypothetical protein ACJ73_04206 [Blastomyces percursus]
MKRPARLRPSVAGQSSTSSSSSMLSRVPLLHIHDLSLPAWDVGDQIPGLRIPLAFLSSLRTNLQISSLNEDLLPPSPLIPVTYTPDPLNPFPHLPAETKKTSLFRSTLNGTPYLPRNTPFTRLHHENANIYKTTPPSNLPTTTTATTLQNLTISPATTADDIHTALHLIADTVSQQRHLAAKCILSHPSILATSLMLFLTIAKLLYTGSLPSDLILMLTLWSLCSLLALLVIQYMVRGYSALAEHVGTRGWLAASSVNGVSQRRDEVLVARCEGEIVGVLVLRIAKTKSVPAPVSSSTITTTPGAGAGAGAGAGGSGDATPSSNASMGPAGFLLPRPRSSRRKSSARWTGIIRAWSVKESHRRCGVGTRLLEEAVGYCLLRSLDGPVFADDHANATQVLPGMFHVKFLEHDWWARRFLERVILEERGR